LVTWGVWVASSGRVLSIVTNTTLLVAATVAVALPLGTLLAVALVRTDLSGRRIVGAVLFATLFVPLYVQAAGWEAAAGVQGWLSGLTPRRTWLEGTPAAVWIHSMHALAWVTGIVAIGLKHLAPELEEDAALWAGGWQILWHVTLRRALPAIAAAAIWVAVTVAGEMAVTDLYQIRTYAEEVYTGFALGGTLGEMFRIVLTALAPFAALVAVLAVFINRRPPTLTPPARPPWVFRITGGRRIVASAGLVVIAVTLLLPLAGLIYKAGWRAARVGDGWDRGWLLSKFIRVTSAGPGDFAREIADTLAASAVAATLALAIALPLAWISVRAPRRRKWLAPLGRGATWLVVALWALPGPVIGVVIIVALNRPELPGLVYLYDRTLAAPTLALLIRVLPMVVLIVWAGLGTIPLATLESAEVAGAGWWTQLCRIALPQRRLTLAIAWVVGLAAASGELAAASLVIPPGRELVSTHILNLLHYGVEDRVAALATLLYVWFAGLSLVAVGLLDRRVIKL
jgi:iron(III) transport system permease protein